LKGHPEKTLDAKGIGPSFFMKKFFASEPSFDLMSGQNFYLLLLEIWDLINEIPDKSHVHKPETMGQHSTQSAC